MGEDANEQERNAARSRANVRFALILGAVAIAFFFLALLIDWS